MTKKEKKELLYIGIAFVVLILLSKQKPGKVIEVSEDFILGAYADYISNPGNLTYEGVPMYLYLARNTQDYETVKAQYLATYRRNLSMDLIARLGNDLSVFVAELYANNQQQIS